MIVRGVEFFPSDIENVVRGRCETGEFAVDLYRRGSPNEIEVRVELRGGDTDARTARMARALRAALGLRVAVQAVPAGTLPRFPVKARRVTDHRASG